MNDYKVSVTRLSNYSNNTTTNVLVWSGGTEPEDAYPNGINTTVAEHLNERDEIAARATGLDDPQQGIRDEDLEWADVLFWWGHLRHDDVAEGTVDCIETAVRNGGMGSVALHSAYYALPFERLIGTSGDLGEARWEDPGEPEILEITNSDHPIVDGVADFALPETEMFGEPFDNPEPDSVVFESTFLEGGEFRSGVTFTFGTGRGAYIRPGHETFRLYHHPEIQQILRNRALWTGA